MADFVTSLLNEELSDDRQLRASSPSSVVLPLTHANVARMAQHLSTPEGLRGKQEAPLSSRRKQAIPNYNQENYQQSPSFRASIVKISTGLTPPLAPRIQTVKRVSFETASTGHKKSLSPQSRPLSQINNVHSIIEGAKQACVGSASPCHVRQRRKSSLSSQASPQSAHQHLSTVSDMKKLFEQNSMKAQVPFAPKPKNKKIKTDDKENEPGSHPLSPDSVEYSAQLPTIRSSLSPRSAAAQKTPSPTKKSSAPSPNAHYSSIKECEIEAEQAAAMATRDKIATDSASPKATTPIAAKPNTPSKHAQVPRIFVLSFLHSLCFTADDPSRQQDCTTYAHGCTAYPCQPRHR